MTYPNPPYMERVAPNCHVQVPVLSAIGKGPKGDKGDKGNPGTDSRYDFQNVLAMIQENDLEAGDICHTIGFHSAGDGGAAYYLISNDALTANSMDIIQLNNGLFAVLQITEGYVTPEMFGAYGDGVHDDTNPVQKSFNSSYTVISSCSKNYKLTNTVSVGDKVVFNGNKCKFVSTATNVFEFSGGRHLFENCIIEGDGTNKVITGNSYYGRFINIEISNCDYGVYFTATQNKIENIFDKLKIYAKSYCVYIGDSNNSYLTDGRITNCDLSLTTASGRHLYIGGCIGWKVDGIHTYGEKPDMAIVLLNVSNTNVSNLEIEDYDNYAIYTLVSNELNISNVNITNKTGTKRPLFISGRNSYEIDKYKVINITNLKFNNRGGAATLIETSRCFIKISNFDYSYDVTDVNFQLTSSGVRYISVDGFIKDSFSSSNPIKIAVPHSSKTTRECTTIEIVGGTNSSFANPVIEIIGLVFAKVSGTYKVVAKALNGSTPTITYTANESSYPDEDGTIDVTVSFGNSIYGAYKYKALF